MTEDGFGRRATVWLQVEDRGAALLSAVLAAAPILGSLLWATMSYRPPRCELANSFGTGCLRMGTASQAFPAAWTAMIVAGAVLSVIAGALYVVWVRRFEARLLFGAVCALCAGVAAVTFASLFALPNAGLALLANPAWIWAPTAIVVTNLIGIWTVKGAGHRLANE